MRKTLVVTVIVAVLSTAGLFASADDASAFGTEGCGEGQCSDCHGMEKETAVQLLKDLPGLDSVDSVDFAQVPGLYAVEVTSKGQKHILYIDFSETYVISGNVIHIAERENITRKHLMNLRRVDLTTVPTEAALVLGNPKASKVAFVFTDPQCPYCEKLHPELKRAVELDPDLVFYIKLLPLVKLHPDSYRISKSIICENSLELLESSFAKQPVPDPVCDTDAIDRTISLARSLGIGSTPTLILPDGRIAPGFRKAEEILKLVNEKQETEAASRKGD
ncbi:MAG: DsbC family protein [bacterium]|nr:MAG: DsbC family protein [bacterium]